MNIFKFFYLSLLLFFLCFLVKVPLAYAAENSFVSVVNPVRGPDFWDQKQQQPVDAVKGQLEILKQLPLPATWLIRYDAFFDPQIIKVLSLSSAAFEKGLFLEVIPSWTKAAGVNYQKSGTWHQAGSVLLTGYSTSDREKLIDVAFESFKKIFGSYPHSVGAWWIDSYSLNYMQQKYQISGALIVSDQYTTDNYQIWGQYWSTPYFPSKRNAQVPAQNEEHKIPVVVMQWAARDPVNGYGGGVQESTYSVQANDYITYHHLDIQYFSKLIDLYTNQRLNQFGHIVVGLENSYSWNIYKDEYQRQMQVLKDKQNKGNLQLMTMKDFAGWYKIHFPKISPEHILVANDPLGSDRQTVWFMNPYYRAGWFFNKDGSVFRDIRQYVDGQTEPCFDTPCQQINFATFSTRVLDDITYNQKLVLDQGKIKDLKVEKRGEDYVLTYKNEAGKEKEIKFMPRDISIDGKIKTIDGLILDTVTNLKKDAVVLNNQGLEKNSVFKESVAGFFLKIIKFLIFLLAAIFIPGFLLVRSLKQRSFIFNIFVSLLLGLVVLTLVSFVLGYLNVPWAIFLYIVGALSFFVYKKVYQEINLRIINTSFIKDSLPVLLLIIMGTFFQSLAMLRSGWAYDFGIGFWGPTGHDGIWHQALINQLIKNVPPTNPAFSGQPLSSYHYFYDLLVAGTFRLTQIPVMDLLYRFYPILFSLLLGFGTWLLIKKLFLGPENSRTVKIITLLTLYFVYFAGSFGWIIDLIKKRELGGESAFWVNQPVSMNLNPPFAISLILIIAVILVLFVEKINRNLISAILLILLIGSLIEFKVYAGIIVLGSLSLMGLYVFITQKDLWYLKVLAGSLILSGVVFLPQNLGSGNFLIFSPFWFIHSMIDFSDRVGWERLSQARMAYSDRGDWIKLILAEGLAFLVFIVGNLGARFLALFLGFIFLRQRLWKNATYIFIVLMSLFSVAIPIFFIQKGNDWNTIQFFYYGLFFCAFFSGVTLVFLYRKFFSGSQFLKSIGLLLGGLILMATPISAVTTFKNGFYNTPPSRLTYGELEALNFLKGLPEGNILTYPFDKNLRSNFKDPYPLYTYETTSYVSAFSGKPTFIEDEIQQEILQQDYKKRLVAANDFFNGRDTSWMKQFLLKNNIKYIYILSSVNIPADSDALNIKQVFENKEAKVFEVKVSI